MQNRFGGDLVGENSTKIPDPEAKKPKWDLQSKASSSARATPMVRLMGEARLRVEVSSWVVAGVVVGFLGVVP